MIERLLPTTLTGARRVNTATVLSLVRQRGPLSRTDLVAESRLSKATVSGIVADLLEHGLVVETGRAQQPRGRSRILLEFNTNAAHVIGVQIGDDRIHVATTDLAGVVQHRGTVDSHVQPPEDMITAIAAEVSRQAALTPVPVLGIGVGAPGLIDPSGRLIRIALSHDWHDVAFADHLEAATTFPVVIANRAQVVTLAHMVLRPNGDAATLVHAYLGDGIVAGVALDGRLYTGGHGVAGEIGHVTVDPDGAQCPSCGTRGCLTVLAGRQRLLASFEATDWDTAVASVHEGDANALEIVATAGRWIGTALASIAAVIDPDVIVLSGPTTDLGAPLIEAIEDQMRANSPTSMPVPVSAVADDAAQGAALLWLQRASATTP